ncbi:hypothetical protein [Bradyrhizobium sp. USDA 4451]
MANEFSSYVEMIELVGSLDLHLRMSGSVASESGNSTVPPSMVEKSDVG